MPEIFMTDWPQYSPDDINRREGTLEAVKLMANAAQTAPNAGGVSQVEAHIVGTQGAGKNCPQDGRAGLGSRKRTNGTFVQV